MSQYGLTDFAWRAIELLLPNKLRVAPRVDDRRVLNGIFWVLRSGAPWRDPPERATRYDKPAANVLTMIQLASMRLWPRA